MAEDPSKIPRLPPPQKRQSLSKLTLTAKKRSSTDPSGQTPPKHRKTGPTKPTEPPNRITATDETSTDPDKAPPVILTPSDSPPVPSSSSKRRCKIAELLTKLLFDSLSVAEECSLYTLLESEWTTNYQAYYLNLLGDHSGILDKLLTLWIAERRALIHLYGILDVKIPQHERFAQLNYLRSRRMELCSCQGWLKGEKLGCYELLAMVFEAATMSAATRGMWVDGLKGLDPKLAWLGNGDVEINMSGTGDGAEAMSN
ncbi:hypothetical protein CC78DRAFT_581172 [Lojkania enalia]|uniref:Uncharacterized protein n=1 Tax=Lojkania enalia TaxID=147567 RepID=A0A9P4K8P1_9PLEO|nr:hypothetical protein CC78DRAFT_581172 [Didymosphaeria enalia]